MNKVTINKWITCFREKWEAQGVRSWTFYHPCGFLVLNEVQVPKEQRSRGYGTKFMKELIKFADKSNLIIALTPMICYGASSLKRLTTFYRRFGFRKNRSEAITETMARKSK